MKDVRVLRAALARASPNLVVWLRLASTLVRAICEVRPALGERGSSIFQMQLGARKPVKNVCRLGIYDQENTNNEGSNLLT